MITYRNLLISGLLATSAALSLHTIPASASNYGPDLAPTDVRLPGNVCHGGKANIVVPIKNFGKQNATGRVQVQLQVRSSAGNKTYTKYIPNGVRANRTGNVTFTNVQTPVAGNYQFVATADSNNRIRETDEGNNSKAASVKITQPCSSNSGQGSNTGKPADYDIVKIDTSKTFCGPRERNTNKVDVVVQNNGRSPGGGYSLQVELKVSPAQSTSNAKTIRKTIPAPGAGKTVAVTFERINIPVCYRTASNFTAKANLLGGNYREGNTRNNQERLSIIIPRRR